MIAGNIREERTDPMNRILAMVLKNLTFVPGAWFRLCRYARHPERYPEETMYRHIQTILRRGIRSGNIRVVSSGQENIPAQGGVMLYGNHQGLFDVLAIAVTCDRPLGVVLKKELANIPFIRQVCRCTKSFAMDREDVRQSLTVIRAVTEEVQKGRGYVIFPEGTRSRQGNTMLEFHGGSFRCAVKSRCPIVPIAFIDSFRVLDEKGCRPVSMEIHYLKPIPYEEYKGLSTTELAALVKGRIQEKLDEHGGRES